MFLQNIIDFYVWSLFDWVPLHSPTVTALRGIDAPCVAFQRHFLETDKVASAGCSLVFLGACEASGKTKHCMLTGVGLF